MEEKRKSQKKIHGGRQLKEEKEEGTNENQPPRPQEPTHKRTGSYGKTANKHGKMRQRKEKEEEEKETGGGKKSTDKRKTQQEERKREGRKSRWRRKRKENQKSVP